VHRLKVLSLDLKKGLLLLKHVMLSLQLLLQIIHLLLQSLGRSPVVCGRWRGTSITVIHAACSQSGHHYKILQIGLTENLYKRVVGLE